VTDSDKHVSSGPAPAGGEPLAAHAEMPVVAGGDVVVRSSALAVPEPVVMPLEPAVVARRLTRLGLGVVLATLDAGITVVGAERPTVDRHVPRGPAAHPAPPASPFGDLGDLALGVLAVTRESALGAVRLLAEGARQATEVARPLREQVANAPVIGGAVAAGRASAEAILSGLADAGRVERQLAADERRAAVRRGMNAAASSELLPTAATALADGVLPATLEPVIDAVLAEALPAVVDRIVADPDLLVPLVTGVLARIAEEPETLDPLLASVLSQLAADPDALLVVVDRILQPVLSSATPLALQQLTDDPHAVRNLVWDQSGGIADELANSLRARTVSADDAIDRWTGRLTLRRARLRRLRRRDHLGTTSDGASPTNAVAPTGTVDDVTDRRGETAGFVSRAFAYVIDAVVVGVLLSAATVAIDAVINLLSDTTMLDTGAEASEGVRAWLSGGVAVAALSLGAVAVVYFTLGWWLFGRTVGKLVMGVRVVEADGTRPGLLQSLVRALLYPVSAIFFVGFALIAATPARRALHDRVARTWVVYDWSAHARSAADDDPLPPTASTAATA
jgi:uncharacterized RDD family membrane protein YckC